MQNPANFINADFPTVQSVVGLAMNPRWTKGMAIVPQARLLDLNLNPVALPVPLTASDPTALCAVNNTGYIQDVVVSMNTKDDVQRSCKFTLFEFPGIGQFNTLKNLVKISAQYYYIEKTGPRLVNEIPVGIFMFTIPDRTLNDTGNIWQITGHSLLQIVNDLGFENDYVIPQGIDIVQAAVGMLMADKLNPVMGGRQPARACGGTGGCVGCLPPSGTGTGSGYAQQGYATTDPLAAMSPVASSTQLRQRGATGFGSLVQYNTTVGMKIDAPSGAPIDPWTCKPMPVQTINPAQVWSAVPGEMSPGTMVPGEPGTAIGPFPAFVLSQLNQAGNQMYMDTTTGKVYDTVTGAENDPVRGIPGTVLTPTLFKQALPLSFGKGGGDGGLAVAQSNTRGYATSFGWSVADTAHALTQQAAPGSATYLHWVPEAGRVVQFYYVAGSTGMKIDGVTGHPIDPWNFQPMPYASTGSGPQQSWAGDLFQASVLYSGSTMYLDPSTAKFYTWDGVQSAGHLTEVHPQWNGTTPTYPQTVFQLAGGDGGVSTLPPGAIGPQTGGVGAYVWPDPNAPGLTPSCCPHSGPNIPAWRIFAVPSPQTVLDPDSLKTVKGDPHTKDTLPFTPKDNQLKSLNNLLATANYWPLYDDESGNFYLAPLPYLDGSMPQADPNFKYQTAVDGVIVPGVVQKLLDQTAIANKVVVRSENTKRASLTAVAYNTSDYSYISIQNLGRVVQKQPAIQLDTITDQSVLQLRAFIEVNLAALPAESIEMTVQLNPFLQVHDVLALTIWSPDGKTLEVSTQSNPFLVTSWEHDFAKRQTKMVLGRLVPL